MSNYIIDTPVATFQAAGKLMLFGEYLVLNGADCIAIPLKYGQDLKVLNSELDFFTWQSSAYEEIWFEVKFNKELEVLSTTNAEISDKLMLLLKLIKTEKPHLFQKSLSFEANADFDLKWGLGSSSTLISLLAQWSQVNPYYLLEKSFGGSGYDVACATVDHPICYSMNTHHFAFVRLSPAVTNKILFVYSGNKQNSKAEIQRYEKSKPTADDVFKMNKIIEKVHASNSIEEFEVQMEESERLLKEILNLESIKSSKFSDYPFAMKSMGAWGGDFFMATFREENEARAYFSDKGYNQHFTYSEIIK